MLIFKKYWRMTIKFYNPRENGVEDGKLSWKNTPFSLQQFMLLIITFLNSIPLSWFFPQLIKPKKYKISNMTIILDSAFSLHHLNCVS